MTNTLHRKGTAESLRQDFVVFAMAKGDIPDLADKLNRFTQICLRHRPVNMSRMEDGTPRRINPRRIDREMQNKVGHSATFDNVTALAAVISD